MDYVQREANFTVQDVKALSSFMMHKHYCENDVEAIIAQMDDDIIWLGAAEHERAAGLETVAGIFRQFAGQVPKCNISDEEYTVLLLVPGVYLCSGRMWIETDPSTQISLRVHQRVTLLFRQVGGRLRCCHIHISNPYGEMTESDVGFPTKMAQQSREYLLEQIELQKRQIQAQTDMLRRMSYEDSLTGLYNRNKFHEVMNTTLTAETKCLGVACFDLNGLKELNDRMGHSAGDNLIRRAADQLRGVFPGRSYRIGGDEFVVVDDTLERDVFLSSVQAVEQGMTLAGISYAVGTSWRGAQCNVKEQFDEADQLMYEQKNCFYSMHGNMRRRCPRHSQSSGPWC